MSTSELISEVNKLPVNKRLALIGQIIKTIRKEEQRKYAVELPYNDYLNNKGLTALTNLDQEGFYEAR